MAISMTTPADILGITPRYRDYGLEHVSDHSCPRRLAGKRHRPDGCWCESRLNDHGATYRRSSTGERVALWEPYSIRAEDLASVASAAATDGLRVDVTGRSPWNPGETVAILFEVPTTERVAR